MYDILFVDEDAGTNFIISKYGIWDNREFFLKKFVSNSQDAIKALNEDKFDIVITDICMSGMGGVALMQEIKKQNMDVTVIICSSHTDFEYVREGMRLGAVDYVSKPLTEQKLKEEFDFLSDVVFRKKDSDMRIIDALSILSEITGKNDKKHSFEELCQDVLIVSICKILSENVEDEMVMDIIAEKLNLTSEYIRVLFKNKTGIQFNKFCTMIKMEYAKNLLKNTNLKIYEVAEKCGYGTIDYFTRLFKNYTGNTPVQFRNN